jgi:hypothetical protein
LKVVDLAELVWESVQQGTGVRGQGLGIEHGDPDPRYLTPVP